MRSEEACSRVAHSLTHEEAALILGLDEKTFHGYLEFYEENSIYDLLDKQLARLFYCHDPVDEVMALGETSGIE